MKVIPLSYHNPAQEGEGERVCSTKSFGDPGSFQLVALLGLQSLPLGSSADGGFQGGSSGPESPPTG